MLNCIITNVAGEEKLGGNILGKNALLNSGLMIIFDGIQTKP
jgi:hypothetical protein